MATEFISGTDHYDKVLAKVALVRKSLWMPRMWQKEILCKSNKIILTAT